jgi:DeoR family transcriptional regulator of aga operon
MDAAGTVTVVADGSKLGRVAFAEIAPIEAVQELVTDDEGDPNELKLIAEAGIAVTIV